jgi:hypothetical protein
MGVEATKRSWKGAHLLALALCACGGRTVLDLGGGSGGPGGASSGGASSGGAGISGDGGVTSDTSDAGTTNPDGGPTGSGSSGGGAPEPANDIVCDYEVCSAPEVCCEQMYTTVSFCMAAAQCTNVAVRCRVDADCPGGSVCCASISPMQEGPTYYTGSTQCLATATCPVGSKPTCDPATAPSCDVGGASPSDKICIDGACLLLGPSLGAYGP